MKSISTIKTLKGKTVLLRADFNVPINGNKVLDPFRIRAVLQTLKHLKKLGANIIIISHAGDDGEQTLAPIAKILSKDVPTVFAPDFRTSKKFFNTKTRVVLCENIRREKGEKKNDSKLAKELASLADVYVNDAFPVSHRAHASIAGVPKYLPSFAGLQLEKEVKHLSQAITKPKKPFIFLLGGAKFETKMPLIKKFISLADYVFVGGALANDFLKADGFEVGTSLVEGGYNLKPLLKNKRLLLPLDVVVTDGKKTRTCAVEGVEKNEKIVDVGPESAKLLSQALAKAHTVLWNGPFGMYKQANGRASTETALKALAKNKQCFSVIGGGDIVAVVSSMKLEKKFSFVSTGGGATLEFLAKGTLPGIKALK